MFTLCLFYNVCVCYCFVFPVSHTFRYGGGLFCFYVLLTSSIKRITILTELSQLTPNTSGILKNELINFKNVIDKKIIKCRKNFMEMLRSWKKQSIGARSVKAYRHVNGIWYELNIKTLLFSDEW